MTAITSNLRPNLKLGQRPSWLGLLGVVILVCAFLSLLQPNFLVEFNLYTLVYNVSLAVIIAFAQMVVVATGGMNLSIGGIGGLSAIIAAGLMQSYGVPMPLTVVIGLVAGIGMGFINGFLTVKTGINPFIITLATLAAYTGAIYGITSANPYYSIDADFINFGQARAGVLPYSTLFTVVAVLAMAILFYRVVAGRWILAVGGNARAAEVVGVPVGRTIILAHVLSGFLAAVAGLLWMSRLQIGVPTIGEKGWLLPSFAIIVIGGCVLEGGAVSIIGVVLASILLAMIENGILINRVDPFWVEFLMGAMILITVGIGRVNRESFRVRRLRRGASVRAEG
jgi:ribose transport system permease protein